MSNLDRRGVPGCAVATEAFKPAAAAQMKALGLEAAVAWVPHPIQNRTAQELEAIANNVIADVIGLISATK
ncbi:MAG TPA: hypothetical protein VHQ88_11570 [Burkholderiales bacterium]|nr:hypothetical protein [Burkholderiales bacterium]